MQISSRVRLRRESIGWPDTRSNVSSPARSVASEFRLALDCLPPLFHCRIPIACLYVNLLFDVYCCMYLRSAGRYGRVQCTVDCRGRRYTLLAPRAVASYIPAASGYYSWSIRGIGLINNIGPCPKLHVAGFLFCALFPFYRFRWRDLHVARSIPRRCSFDSDHARDP